MDKQYLCPHCNGHLQITDSIILLGRKENNQQGFIILHPEVGNYTCRKHPSFIIEENEPLELICPLCHESLSSDFDENLSHLSLIEDDKIYDIYFSRIHGEKSTFLVDGDSVIASGEHAERYTYFKMSDKFKQYLKK